MAEKKKTGQSGKRLSQAETGGQDYAKTKSDALAKEVGRRILEARNGLGLSQQGLHGRTKLHDPEGIGISRAVLSLYETGVNKPGAREIRILCETLKVTPNWLLYGVESPGKTIQPAFDFLRGSELVVSVRLAHAMLVLDPAERDAFASLLFSLLTRKLGDVGLSSLMGIASMTADELLKKVYEVVGDEAKDMPLREVLDKFAGTYSTGVYTNWGNLRPAIPEDQMDDFDPSALPPPRKLKDK